MRILLSIAVLAAIALQCGAAALKAAPSAAVDRAVAAPGVSAIRLMSAEGPRVWADGEIVSDTWTPHASRVDRSPLAGGAQRFRIRHGEALGFAELRFDIQRR